MNRFYTVARNETESWEAETLARLGIRAAFGLYLIREGEATYCCEITPSSRADWLQNVFILTDEESAVSDLAHWEMTGEEQARQAEREGLETESGGEASTYFRFIDPAHYDARFIAGPIEVEPEDIAYMSGPDHPDAEWYTAVQLWHENPDHPAILSEGTFDAWDREQTAKRRAEMVPPLSHRGEGMLPLFVAAARAMLPNGEPTPETDAAFRGLKWI